MTRHWGDEELPRYEFLAWLQSIYNDMDQARLFPVWEDAYSEYLNLKTTKKGLDAAESLRSGIITGWDSATMKPVYDFSDQTDLPAIEHLAERIEFAAPLLKKALQQSRNLEKQWLKDIQFGVWGLHMPNLREGLLFTVIRPVSELWAWQFQTSVQAKARYPWSAIRTRLIGKYSITLSNGLDNIRRECLSHCGWTGSVVSTFVAETDRPLPVVYTLKPLAVMKLADEVLPLYGDR